MIIQKWLTFYWSTQYIHQIKCCHVQYLRSLCITHYVIFSVILYEFNELNGGKLTFFLISFAKRVKNDVQDDVMCDGKWSSVSLKFKCFLAWGHILDTINY